LIWLNKNLYMTQKILIDVIFYIILSVKEQAFEIAFISTDILE